MRGQPDDANDDRPINGTFVNERLDGGPGYLGDNHKLLTGIRRDAVPAYYNGRGTIDTVTVNPRGSSPDGAGK